MGFLFFFEKLVFFEFFEKGKIRKTNGAFQFQKTRKIPIFQKKQEAHTEIHSNGGLNLIGNPS